MKNQVSNISTNTRIMIPDLERLRIHAFLNKRSMTQQLGQFIPPISDAAAKKALEKMFNSEVQSDQG